MSQRNVVLQALALVFCLPLCAFGGTLTWTGSADNDFNNPGNWNLTSGTDNGTDGIPSGGDQAYLPAALSTSINVSSGVTTNTIYQLAGTGSGYTLSGQPLVNNSFRVDNAATMIVNNDVSTSSGNLTLQPQNPAAVIEIHGTITSLAGSLALTGSGRIDLFQANTFTAGVQPTGTSLTVIHNPLALGNGGLMQVISGSTPTFGLVSDLDWDGGLRLAHAGSPGLLNVQIQSGTGDRTFTVTGGTTNHAGSISLNPNVGGSTGNLILKFERTAAGSTTIQNAISTSDNSIVELDGPSGATFNLTSGTSSGDATISGTGKLVKSGASSAVISVDQTYSGGTDIDGGMVQLVGPNGSLPDSGVIKLAAGTTLDFNGVDDTVGALAGVGTVDLGGANVTASEGVQPGLSPGTLTIEGGGSLAISGLSTFELDSLSGTNDLVQFTGAADLQLGGTLKIVNLGGLELGNYTLFELNGGSVSGSFDQVIVPGFTGTVVQIGGNVLLNVSPIPEPGTALLAGCGLIALIGLRRKRRAAI